AGVVVAGVAAAVAVEAGHRVQAAGRERLAQHVQRCLRFAAVLHAARLFSMRRANTVISFSACLSPFLCAAAMPSRKAARACSSSPAASSALPSARRAEQLLQAFDGRGCRSCIHWELRYPHTKAVIQTKDAPAAIGTYSQAVR